MSAVPPTLACVLSPQQTRRTSGSRPRPGGFRALSCSAPPPQLPQALAFEHQQRLWQLHHHHHRRRQWGPRPTRPGCRPTGAEHRSAFATAVLGRPRVPLRQRPRSPPPPTLPKAANHRLLAAVPEAGGGSAPTRSTACAPDRAACAWCPPALRCALPVLRAPPPARCVHCAVAL